MIFSSKGDIQDSLRSAYRSLVEQGADTIAFASCISKGTPIGYPCPFAKRMRELVQKEVGDGVRILDYTHDAGPEPETSQK